MGGFANFAQGMSRVASDISAGQQQQLQQQYQQQQLRMLQQQQDLEKIRIQIAQQQQAEEQRKFEMQKQVWDQLFGSTGGGQANVPAPAPSTGPYPYYHGQGPLYNAAPGGQAGQAGAVGQAGGGGLLNPIAAALVGIPGEAYQWYLQDQAAKGNPLAQAELDRKLTPEQRQAQTVWKAYLQAAGGDPVKATQMMETDKRAPREPSESSEVNELLEQIRKGTTIGSDGQPVLNQDAQIARFTLAQRQQRVAGAGSEFEQFASSPEEKGKPFPQIVQDYAKASAEGRQDVRQLSDDEKAAMADALNRGVISQIPPGYEPQMAAFWAAHPGTAPEAGGPPQKVLGDRKNEIDRAWQSWRQVWGTGFFSGIYQSLSGDQRAALDNLHGATLAYLRQAAAMGMQRKDVDPRYLTEPYLARNQSIPRAMLPPAQGQGKGSAPSAQPGVGAGGRTFHFDPKQNKPIADNSQAQNGNSGEGIDVDNEPSPGSPPSLTLEEFKSLPREAGTPQSVIAPPPGWNKAVKMRDGAIYGLRNWQWSKILGGR